MLSVENHTNKFLYVYAVSKYLFGTNYDFKGLQNMYTYLGDVHFIFFVNV